MDYASGDYLYVSESYYLVVDSRSGHTTLYAAHIPDYETFLMENQGYSFEEPVTKIFRGEVYE